MFCLNCDTLVILSEEYDPSIHQLISEQYPDNNIVIYYLLYLYTYY